jgi:hypothetical protein
MCLWHYTVLKSLLCSTTSFLSCRHLLVYFPSSASAAAMWEQLKPARCAVCTTPRPLYSSPPSFADDDDGSATPGTDGSDALSLGASDSDCTTPFPVALLPSAATVVASASVPVATLPPSHAGLEADSAPQGTGWGIGTLALRMLFVKSSTRLVVLSNGRGSLGGVKGHICKGCV